MKCQQNLVCLVVIFLGLEDDSVEDDEDDEDDGQGCESRHEMSIPRTREGQVASQGHRCQNPVVGTFLNPGSLDFDSRLAAITAGFRPYADSVGLERWLWFFATNRVCNR